MRPLLSALVLLVPTLAVADLAPPRPRQKQCVKDIGCPAIAAPPRCDAGKVLTPQEALANRSALLGKTVSITGTLAHGPMGCTEMECAEDQCCNTCWADVQFVIPRSGQDGGIALDGVSCTGDDTGVCCSVPLGKALTVVGVLKNDQGRTRLEVAKTCSAP